MGDYTELQLLGQSIAGAREMNPKVPAQVPSVYFNVRGQCDALRHPDHHGDSHEGSLAVST